MKAPVAACLQSTSRSPNARSSSRDQIEKEALSGGEPVGPDYRTRDPPNHILHVRRQKFVWSNWEEISQLRQERDCLARLVESEGLPKESAAGRILCRCATK